MKLLFVLLSTLPLVAFCQKDSTKTRGVVFGITYSPDYCFRTLKPDGSEIAQTIANRRNADEKPVFGFTTGLSVLFPVSTRFIFETGVHYSSKGEQTKKFDLVWPQPDPSLPVKISSVHHYNYLDIPFKAQFLFARSRMVPLKFLKKVMRGKVSGSDIGFFVSGGFSANVFLNESNTSTSEYSDGHVDTQKSYLYDGLSRVNIAAIAGIGMKYFIAQRISIRIEPVFRHSITPILDAPIKQYLWSAGVNAGLCFSLK